MAEEKAKENEIVQIPVAKRHKLLADINDQVNGMEVSDTFEVAGHSFVMTTITADEEVWADSFCNTSSQISAFSSLKVPRLSASIKSIDAVPIEDLFQFPEDMSEAEKKFHSSSEYRLRYWHMNQMMLWLGDRSAKFVSELWVHYSSLTERRDASWNKLKKSLTRTQDGKLEATSLPEKGSSSATQTSPA